MKYSIIFLGLVCVLRFQSAAQGTTVKKAEESFVDFFGWSLFKNLGTVSLSEGSFRKLFYFSYQVVGIDSISWISHNYHNQLIDSIAYKAFTESVDSIKKTGIISLIRNEERTYIPVFIFYNNTSQNINNDSVSITPMDILFSWGKNENLNPEPIYRITNPFIFRLPKPNAYLRKKSIR